MPRRSSPNSAARKYLRASDPWATATRPAAEIPQSRRAARPALCKSRSSACRTPPCDGTETHGIANTACSIVVSADRRKPLSEQDRGEPLAAFDRRFISRTPCVEKLHKLLACTVIVPFAVAFDDRQQMFERVEPAALAVERQRKIEARLMIERIGRELLFKFIDRPHGFGLLGEF